MMWDQAQSSLFWKGRCPFVPLFCLTPPQVREEQDTQMPFFMYSHSFTHIAYKVEVSTQSSVLLLLPLPPVCMQVNKYIPNAMTQFPSALPFSLLDFSLSLFLFTDSYVEGEGGRNWTLGPLIWCMYADRMFHTFTLQVHRLHLPYQISLHTPSDLWGDE